MPNAPFALTSLTQLATNPGRMGIFSIGYFTAYYGSGGRGRGVIK